MSEYAWRPVGNIDPRELGEARHLAHNGAQWLARIASSYIEPDADDAHTSLSWENDGDALVTQEIAPGLVLELRVPELTLQFKEGGERVTYQLEMDDVSPAKVEAWLLVELLHRGVDRDRLSKDLPYKIPGLLTGDAVEYSAATAKDKLEELSRWYANAASVLEQVRDEYAPSETKPSQIRCWPRDGSMEIVFHRDGSDNEPAVKVGMSPGDGHYGEPYFHVTPTSPPAAKELPKIPEIGHWHTKDFVAAILTGSQIVDNEMTGDDVTGFLGAAITADQARPDS